MMTFCLEASSGEMVGTGLVVSEQNRTLQSQSPGVLVKLLIQEGALVEKGQIVAVMQSKEAERQLLKATAKLQRARTKLKVAEAKIEFWEQRLGDGKNHGMKASRTETLQFEIAKLGRKHAEENLKVAEKRIEHLQVRLDGLHVRAPFDGEVARIYVNPGDVLSNAGTPLLTIHNPSKLIANVRFPVSVTGLKDRKLPNGGHFHVVLRSEAFEEKIDGIVSAFAPIVEPSSQTISTKIHFDNEKYSWMLPGLKVIAVPRGAAD